MEVENPTEIRVKRLLHRLQAALSENSHSASAEDEIARRWVYVDFAKKLLSGEPFNQFTSEEDLKRLSLYESKLKFISDLMLASEGRRPSLKNSLVPVPSIIQTNNPDFEMKSLLLSKEEEHLRTSLLEPPRRVIPPEAELRKQLGLSPVSQATTILKPSSLADQLERDSKVRENIADSIVGAMSNLLDYTSSVHVSLQGDQSRIAAVSQTIERNAENLNSEINRLSSIYLSGSISCRTMCMVVLITVAIVFGIFIVVKITPRPT